MSNPFDEAIQEVREKMEQAVEISIIMIEADSKLLCPVDTGTLKRSLPHEVKSEDKKVKGAVGTNVSYAYWAERHQPYLEPAVDMNMENIKIKIKEVMEE